MDVFEIDSIDDVARFIEYVNQLYVLIFVKPIVAVKQYAPLPKEQFDLFVLTIQYLLKEQFDKNVSEVDRINVRSRKAFSMAFNIFELLVDKVMIPNPLMFDDRLYRFDAVKLQRSRFCSKVSVAGKKSVAEMSKTVCLKYGELIMEVAEIDEYASESDNSSRHSTPMIIQSSIDMVIETVRDSVVGEVAESNVPAVDKVVNHPCESILETMDNPFNHNNIIISSCKLSDKISLDDLRSIWVGLMYHKKALRNNCVDVGAKINNCKTLQDVFSIATQINCDFLYIK